YKLPVLCDQGAGKDAENLWGAADNALYIRSLIQDLLGIPEEHTWEYSEALAKTIEEKGFDRLDLRRVMDVIGFTDQEPITKQNYLSLTHRSREVLMQKYGKTEDDIKALINTDHDILMTYRGFIRFLETDFRYVISSGRVCGAHQIVRYSEIASRACSGSQYRNSVKSIAKAMMIRAEVNRQCLSTRFVWNGTTPTG
ncbi:MAG: hypothetical protein Q9198_008604, partial [Flavoplaca austrocitrina]